MKKGFTLIELLVVMGIIAILASISIFALQGSRTTARDAKRKSDLETIRSALELYKADCNQYPNTLPAPNSPLIGTGAPTSCAAANTYLQKVPGDPTTSLGYCYNQTSNNIYELCANLEDNPTSPSACGSCDSGSNIGDYKVLSP